MNKRTKRGLLLIAAGVVLILAGLSMHMMHERKAALAGENARILLEQLTLNKTEAIPSPEQEKTETDPVKDDPTAMPEKDYMGYSMIGSLRVPSAGIELPILSSWSYDLLGVTACRYSGSIPTNDMILLGHNYISHFGPLQQVKIGDLIEFEDVNGKIYSYVVMDIETLHKTDGERLSSEYALSLFTCTLSGQNRIVVRCDLLEE